MERVTLCNSPSRICCFPLTTRGVAKRRIENALRETSDGQVSGTDYGAAEDSGDDDAG